MPLPNENDFAVDLGFTLLALLLAGALLNLAWHEAKIRMRRARERRQRVAAIRASTVQLRREYAAEYAADGGVIADFFHQMDPLPGPAPAVRHHVRNRS